MRFSEEVNELLPDEWFTKVFKDPGIILLGDSSKIDWFKTGDFQALGVFLVNLIREAQGRIKKADDSYLYSASRQLCETMEWIRLVSIATGPSYMLAIERLFKEEFGDENVHIKTYNACFKAWLGQKVGQYKIGYNHYNILEGDLFYRDRFGQWFEIDKETAFDLKPKRNDILTDKDKIVLLNKDYRETPYDKVISLWNKKGFKGVLKDDFLRFKDKETSPEEYLKFTVKHINELIKNPISIGELERWSGSRVEELEHLVKISSFLLEMVKKQGDQDHHVYLLRDCLVFYELRKTLDILTGENTSVDQLLIGRKLLKSKHKRWGFWIVAYEIFYHAHKIYPTNFAEFYREYSRLMNLFFSLNPDFAKVITAMSEYIKKHIHTDRKNIIFDVGFNGTINLLTKYIVDNHINIPNQKLKTDVKLAVGAPWLKKLFKERYETDYFFFMHHIQLMARSEHLYSYKSGSLKSGKLTVKMGSKKWQRKATVELVVLVMVALLSTKK
jgi:hypothetical protein